MHLWVGYYVQQQDDKTEIGRDKKAGSGFHDWSSFWTKNRTIYFMLNRFDVPVKKEYIIIPDEFVNQPTEPTFEKITTC